MGHIDLTAVNADLGRNAPALVEWALGLGKTSIVTTNFRPFEAVILHMVTQVNPKVPVVWMDNGYNTEATYRFADEVTKQLGLNLKIYLPLRSRSFRFVVIDEAFGRGSDESAQYGLRLFEQLNLQLLIVTPLQKIHIIEPFVASVGFVHNEGGSASKLRNLSIEEYRAQKAEMRAAAQAAPRAGGAASAS